MKYVMGFLFYLKNIIIWLDQGLNTLLMGDPDETLSRRAGRARNAGRKWGCLLCKVLDWIDPRHCGKSIEGDDEFEGRNSVANMVSRWQLGLPPTWTPEFVTKLGPTTTIEAPEWVGEVYADKDIDNLNKNSY